MVMSATIVYNLRPEEKQSNFSYYENSGSIISIKNFDAREKLLDPETNLETFKISLFIDLIREV
jgi:hypothetical protein